MRATPRTHRDDETVMDACLCDPEQRTAFEADMSDGGVRRQMHVYGGVRHSFTNATLEGREVPGLAYDRFAAEHTRQSVLALLKRTLKA